MCGLLSAPHTFTCTAYTKAIAHVKDPMSISSKKSTEGHVVEAHKYCINSCKIIKMINVATPKGRSAVIVIDIDVIQTF